MSLEDFCPYIPAFIWVSAETVSAKWRRSALARPGALRPTMRAAAAQPSPQPEEPPHSPLPLAKRRRRRIADSDEEEEAATPTSARYAARACSSAAVEAGVYPPLAEDAGLEVVQRFAEIFQGKALPEPKNVKKVAPESLLAAFRQNLDAHGLKRERDTVSGSTQTIVVQRPAQDKVVNFRTPDDCPEEKYYSVPNALMASKMTQLGYKKIGITHLPPDVDTLPLAVGELTRAAASRRRAGAPATARVCPCRAYNRCPDIDKAASAPTAAMQLVLWMENKVVMEIGGVRKAFSPIRLWTASLRKAAKFLPDQSTPLAARCKAYLFVRRNMSEHESATINASYDELRINATKCIKKFKAGEVRKMLDGRARRATRSRCSSR